jgi:dUTP pyrophosphatase
MVTVKIVKDDPWGQVPKGHSPEAAGLDLVGIEKFVIEPGECALVDTGIKVQIPTGYAGFVLPRSGMTMKKGLTVMNAPGLIDSDYRGNVKVLLYNTRKEAQEVTAGDRIAQLVIMKVELAQFRLVGQLDATERGEGGFGSTGGLALVEEDSTEDLGEPTDAA